MRSCTDCQKDISCDRFDKLVNRREGISANLNELKRDPLNEIGHMLPMYIIT